MKKSSTITNEKLKILVTALIFGGIWGFLEITIGTILHFEAIETIGSVFVSSTTVMIPIAYFLMAGAYKQTGAKRTIIYMGLIASAIKLSSLFLFVNPTFFMAIMPYKLMPIKVINPAISIVFESLITCGVLAAVKPEKILSKKAFITVIFSNFLWSTAFMALNAFFTVTKLATSPQAMFVLNENKLTMNNQRVIEYLISSNFVGAFYVALVGCVAFGIKTLVVKYGKTVQHEKLNSIAFNKIAASICASLIPVIAVITTVFLSPFAYAKGCL